MTLRKRMAILGTRGIPARYGGFETFAEELALRLVAHGVAVTVFCEAGLSEPLSEFRGVDLAYVPITKCGAFTTILFDLRSLWRARKDYDVVYMLGYGAAPFCLIPRLWGKEVWLNVDGVEWARAKWGAAAKCYFRWMEWFSTWVPDRIIADAEGIRVHLESRHRVRKPCVVIPYGAPVVERTAESAVLDEWGLTSGDYYLLVARIEPENHVREIVEGYLASSSTAPLVVVGNHQSGTEYAQSMSAYEDVRVRLVGGVYDQSKLQALRCHARAYFHGHSVGGTNPSLLEALGCGNLVIAHDNVFNREVLGDLGFYFREGGGIPALLTAVDAMDEANRNKLCDQAISKIRDKYAWDAICKSYLSLLGNA